ncbi:MAG: hypothetical protein O7D32_06205 [bacterium]|nr:hypothetical protein [bacterium]
MTIESKTRYYIMRQGALKEELREWSEIVSMCETGHLTPEAFVFMPDDEQWKKVTDTELGRFFDKAQANPKTDVESGIESGADKHEEYHETLERIAQAPDDWSLRLQAADMALAAGDRRAALDHYQAALEARHYHPRIVNDIIRNLTPEEQETLRYLKRVGPFWGEPLVLLTYPFGRSYIYPAVLAAVLWLSTLATVTRAVGGFIALFWVFHVIRAVARRETLPPLWHGIMEDPVVGLLKPLGSLVALLAELFLPLLAVLQILASVGLVEESNAFAYINNSPMMSVGIFTFSAIYLPAALMLMACTPRGLLDALNPKRVISAIGAMEVDYLMAVVLFFVLAGISAGIGAITWRIPIAGTLPTAIVETYLVLVMGCVLGMLYGRFKDRISG